MNKFKIERFEAMKILEASADCRSLTLILTLCIGFIFKGLYMCWLLDVISMEIISPAKSQIKAPAVFIFYYAIYK